MHGGLVDNALIRGGEGWGGLWSMEVRLEMGTGAHKKQRLSQLAFKKRPKEGRDWGRDGVFY